MKGKTLIEIDNTFYYVIWKYKTYIENKKDLMIKMDRVVIRKRKRILANYKYKFIKNKTISTTEFAQTINKHIEHFVHKLNCTYMSKHMIQIYINVNGERGRL